MECVYGKNEAGLCSSSRDDGQGSARNGRAAQWRTRHRAQASAQREGDDILYESQEESGSTDVGDHCAALQLQHLFCFGSVLSSYENLENQL